MLSERKAWLLVAVAYLAGAVLPILVMIELASGYGSSFLGLGTPPNSETFRQAVGIAAFAALAVVVTSSLFVVRRGNGRQGRTER